MTDRPAELPLIGRSRELSEISDLVSRRRLVTICGSGGVGKTRLARAVAEVVVPTRQVRWVSLSSIDESNLAPALIAAAVGGRLGDGELAWSALGRLLVDFDGLIVLDNLEQLDGIAPNIETLLASAPGVKLLCTSRTALHLDVETVIELSPLDALPGDEASPSDAATLFLTAAARVQPGKAWTDGELATIEAICRSLDGLPLAIEIIANRLALFSPQAILSAVDASRNATLHLPTADEHHRTLDATLRRSYTLLTDEQRLLFRRLSMLPAGVSISLAEALSVMPARALSVLLELRQHNLIQAGEDVEGSPRFGMLETIRAFAGGRLDEEDDRAYVRRQLLTAFQAQAASMRASRFTPTENDAFMRLDREFPSIHALVEESLQRGNGDERIDAARLVVDLGPLLESRGHLSIGTRWTTLLLESLAGDTDQAAALWHLRGRLYLSQGRYELAERDLRNALNPALSSRLHDRLWSDFSLGLAEFRQSRIPDAIERLQRTIVDARALGIAALEVRALNSLGLCHVELDDFAQARADYSAALELARRTSNVVDQSMMMINLALLEQREGNIRDAIDLLDECVLLCEQNHDLDNAAMSYLNLSGALLSAGESDRADAIADEALRRFRQLGNLWGESLILVGRADLARARGDLDAELALRREVLPLQRIIGRSDATVITLLELARLWESSGNSPRSRQALSEARLLMGDRGELATFYETTFQLFRGESRSIEPLEQVIERWRLNGDMRLIDQALSLIETLTGHRDLSAHTGALLRDAGRRVPRQAESTGLSERERQVLQRLALGRTDRQIADELSISTRTVGFHVSNIIRKLNVGSRTEAAAWAVRHRIG